MAKALFFGNGQKRKINEVYEGVPLDLLNEGDWEKIATLIPWTAWVTQCTYGPFLKTTHSNPNFER